MPTNYVFPTTEDLSLIEQDKLPRLIAAPPVFGWFPIVNKDAHVVSWEQKDNYTGLQAVRGLGGQPGRVKAVGGNRYTVEPGIYGEFRPIDELEITARRPYGAIAEAKIDISDLVAEAQDHLMLRRLDRIEQIIWGLATTGTFSVANGQGVLHTDAFPIQTYAAGVAWATSATATPLANFRAVQLLSRGRSTSFGANATAYMNRTTFNSLVSNTNSADIAGRRTSGLNTVLNLDEINRVLMGEDLPQVAVYDEGYFDDAGAFQLFIPNNKVIVVGVRPGGVPVGEYVVTRNANNPGVAPGAYTKVVEKDDVPKVIEVHDGHNGAPALKFPGSIVTMSV